eukprot:s7979_g2.t1
MGSSFSGTWTILIQQAALTAQRGCRSDCGVAKCPRMVATSRRVAMILGPLNATAAERHHGMQLSLISRQGCTSTTWCRVNAYKNATDIQVRWSPDQKQIISAGKDGCIIVWNFFEL